MNGWKIAAIILIVFFILENLVIAGLWVWASNDEKLERENEYVCWHDICTDDAGLDGYKYYHNRRICECYLGREVKLTEYLGEEYNGGATE